MLSLEPIIARIRVLLGEDTDASVIYAALEARLALEKVVYDRLRQRHSYISHADLAGWNPGYVVNKIIAEVDPGVTETITLSIGKNPGAKPDEDDFVEVGTEIGFDASRVSKLWNALAKLALHVRLPEHKDDEIPDYGDKARVRDKVEEVVAELDRLAKGTMAFSGLGNEVSFTCSCGQINKRKTGLLKQGQSISCFNPQCSRSFTVEIHDNGDVYFGVENVEIPCAACNSPTAAPRREVDKIKPGEERTFACKSCGYVNKIMWILVRANLPDDSSVTASKF